LGIETNKQINTPLKITDMKATIIQNGLTQDDVAKFLKISQQAFSSKINNKSEFKASEIIKLSELLGIEDKDTIFFVQ
jgi:transcriptional regulator with XRE-family HTH domain